MKVDSESRALSSPFSARTLTPKHAARSLTFLAACRGYRTQCRRKQEDGMRARRQCKELQDSVKAKTQWSTHSKTGGVALGSRRCDTSNARKNSTLVHCWFAVVYMHRINSAIASNSHASIVDGNVILWITFDKTRPTLSALSCVL